MAYRTVGELVGLIEQCETLRVGLVGAFGDGEPVRHMDQIIASLTRRAGSQMLDEHRKAKGSAPVTLRPG